MSLHDILMERAALQHPEFRKDYGKGTPSTALDNLSELALYSAKLAQAQIAEEQKAEQQRIAKAKNTEQLLKMPIPENTDAETIMSIGDGGIDVKRVLKSKDSTGGTKGVYIVNKETGELKKTGEVEKGAEVFSSFLSPEMAAERTRASGEVKRGFEAEAFIRDANNIKIDLNEVFDDFKSVPENLKGPLQGMTTGQIAAYMQTPAGENLKLYNDSVEFFLSNVARSLGGERGVLTDRDIERIRKFMPQSVDSMSLAEKKISKVNSFIQRRIDERKKETKKSVDVKINSVEPTVLSDEEARDEFEKYMRGE
jgi:hypothetical protein